MADVANPLDDLDIFKDDSASNTKTNGNINNNNSESKSKRKKNSLNVPKERGSNDVGLDSADESLHEMVQSILNDSDNDVVLNNLNGLGYNNIQYNDNTASNIYTRHAQINNNNNNDNTSSIQQNGDAKLFPPIDVLFFSFIYFHPCTIYILYIYIE